MKQRRTKLGGRQAHLLGAALTMLVLGLAWGGCGSGTAHSTGPGGAGGAVTCGSGATLCGGSCVETQNDPANCGACGTACPAGQVCSAGKCGVTCLGGSTLCGTTCVQTQNDPANCGACGTACPTGQVCSTGKCGVTCLGGSTPCGGSCVQTQSDPNNCGACGTACPAGQVCSSGKCGVTCLGGSTLCTPDGGVPACVQTQSDPDNCSACGMVCPAPTNTTAYCSAGVCGYACNAGFLDCALGQSGCSVNGTTDVNNCGACGNKCAMQAATTSVGCSGAACKVTGCSAGYGDCNGVYTDGCEVDTNTDVNNCGSCGKPCAASLHCFNGTCTAVDLTNLAFQYSSAARNVYVFNTTACTNLAANVTFCQAHGLQWWKPVSQPDAQALITNAYSHKASINWINIYGVTSASGVLGGYAVTTDNGACVSYNASPTDWVAVRKWSCSFCYPTNNGSDSTYNGESCCWDGPTDGGDYFACQD
jgi:hypothetical protein